MFCDLSMFRVRCLTRVVCCELCVVFVCVVFCALFAVLVVVVCCVLFVVCCLFVVVGNRCLMFGH